jgi:hypothetical protein
MGSENKPAAGLDNNRNPCILGNCMVTTPPTPIVRLTALAAAAAKRDQKIRLRLAIQVYDLTIKPYARYAAWPAAKPLLIQCESIEEAELLVHTIRQLIEEAAEHGVEAAAGRVAGLGE